MRLDYNILWIEDQVDHVLAQKDKIETRLRAEGFRLDCKFVASVDEGLKTLGESIFKDHVDLVIVDLNLGTGISGDEGLPELRQRIPYKDIVFYSGASTTELRSRVNAQQVDGVYVSNREELPEVVLGVVEHVLHRSMDIDHARGVALGAFSEIEFKIDEVLADRLRDALDGSDGAMGRSINKLIERKRESAKEAFAVLESITEFEDLERFRGIITASDRAVLLRKALELLGQNGDVVIALRKYEQEILPRRNDLAHLRVRKEGFMRTFYARNEVIVGIDEMRDLRLELLSVDELLDQVWLEAVSAQSGEEGQSPIM